MPLDARILKVATRPMRPVEISRAIIDQFPEATTQRVASRLKALTARGLVIRHRPSGGPANGPGTSLYQAAQQDGEDSSDG